MHQDRLVKKLRRQGIQSYSATNAYLEAEYLPEHNDRFARAAAKAEDYHAKAPIGNRLQEIFRLEAERWVSNDWVIQYRGRHLQLQPRSRRYGPTQAKALVCEWEDSGIEVRYIHATEAFLGTCCLHSGPSSKQSRTPPNRLRPEAWPFECGRWEPIVATDEETERRAAKEECCEEIANFARRSSSLDAQINGAEEMSDPNEQRTDRGYSNGT